MKRIEVLVLLIIVFMLTACHHGERLRLQPAAIVPKGQPLQQKTYDDSLQADQGWQMFPVTPAPEQLK